MEDITKILGLDEDTIFDDVKTYVRSLKDTMFEKEQLKKQLNKAIKDKETQQKEFINYLGDEIQKKRKKSTTLTAFIRNVVPLQQCLLKYKEIIGVSDEKK